MKSYSSECLMIIFKKIITSIIIFVFIFSLLTASSALANQNLRPIEILQGGNGTAGAIGKDLQSRETEVLVREVAGTGIFKPTKTALKWAFKQMAAFYKDDAQRFNNAVAWLENTDAITVHAMARESQITRAPPQGKLVILYAGPGAGKSILTARAIDRIPFKWLVVYATRNTRPGEKIGNPFYKYGMTREEFDSFPDNDPRYIKSGTREKGYVVDVEASKKLMQEGNNLIIHSWIWTEFVDRSSAFEGTIPICLYVGREATIKRLAYRLIKEEAAGHGLLPNGYPLPKKSSEADPETIKKDLQRYAPEIYEDYLKRLAVIDDTQTKYDEIRSSEERKALFRYLVDNSGPLAVAERDLMSILISDRYQALSQNEKIFPEFFGQYVERAGQLENQLRQWRPGQQTAVQLAKAAGIGLDGNRYEDVAVNQTNIEDSQRRLEKLRQDIKRRVEDRNDRVVSDDEAVAEAKWLLNKLIDYSNCSDGMFRLNMPDHMREMPNIVRKLTRDPSSELLIASMLHDADRFFDGYYVWIKDEPPYDGDIFKKYYKPIQHPRMAADFARPLLISLRIDERIAAKVDLLIRNHELGITQDRIDIASPLTAEERQALIRDSGILKDADAISSFTPVLFVNSFRELKNEGRQDESYPEVYQKYSRVSAESRKVIDSITEQRKAEYLAQPDGKTAYRVFVRVQDEVAKQNIAAAFAGGEQREFTPQPATPDESLREAILGAVHPVAVKAATTTVVNRRFASRWRLWRLTHERGLYLHGVFKFASDAELDTCISSIRMLRRVLARNKINPRNTLKYGIPQAVEAARTPVEFQMAIAMAARVAERKIDPGFVLYAVPAAITVAQTPKELQGNFDAMEDLAIALAENYMNLSSTFPYIFQLIGPASRTSAEFQRIVLLANRLAKIGIDPGNAKTGVLSIITIATETQHFHQVIAFANRLIEKGIDPTNALKYGISSIAKASETPEDFQAKVNALEGLVTRLIEKGIASSSALQYSIPAIARASKMPEQFQSKVIALEDLLTRLKECKIDPRNDTLEHGISAIAILPTDQFRQAMALANCLVKKGIDPSDILRDDIPVVASVSKTPEQFQQTIVLTTRLTENGINPHDVLRRAISKAWWYSIATETQQFRQPIALATLLVEFREQIRGRLSGLEDEVKQIKIQLRNMRAPSSSSTLVYVRWPYGEPEPITWMADENDPQVKLQATRIEEERPNPDYTREYAEYKRRNSEGINRKSLLESEAASLNRLLVVNTAEDAVLFLKDESPNIRRLTAQFLGRMGPAEAKVVIPVLSEALRDKDLEVREAVVIALNEIQWRIALIETITFMQAIVESKSGVVFTLGTAEAGLDVILAQVGMPISKLTARQVANLSVATPEAVEVELQKLAGQMNVETVRLCKLPGENIKTLKTEIVTIDPVDIKVKITEILRRFGIRFDDNNPAKLEAVRKAYEAASALDMGL